MLQSCSALHVSHHYLQQGKTTAILHAFISCGSVVPHASLNTNQCLASKAFLGWCSTHHLDCLVADSLKFRVSLELN